MYLIAKTSLNIDKFELDRIISCWFFMTSLTGRYTEASPETVMERDLAFLRNIKDQKEFIAWIEKTIENEFTGDFWTTTLPNRLETSSATSPLMFAYYASLNLLNAKVLFSNKKVHDLMDPALKSKRKSIEKHHLFPRKFLKKTGFITPREINQISNFALVEWSDNISISSKSPSEYYPLYTEKFSADEIAAMHYYHALPPDWHNMMYLDFLSARRKLMAKVIYDGYKFLSTGEKPHQKTKKKSVQEIISQGETSHIEFKSTLRINIYTNEKDPKIEHSVLKTIAGFLNSGGGTLLIGVTDEGKPIGIDADEFKNEDIMNRHLVSIINSKIGTQHMLYIQPRFESYNGFKILVVDCLPSQSPIYLKDDKKEIFYIRTGASTVELKPSQIQEYIKNRFPL
jgi:uncharacterized protein YaaQ